MTDLGERDLVLIGYETWKELVRDVQAQIREIALLRKSDPNVQMQNGVLDGEEMKRVSASEVVSGQVWARTNQAPFVVVFGQEPVAVGMWRETYSNLIVRLDTIEERLLSLRSVRNTSGAITLAEYKAKRGVCGDLAK
jgi:hypothetical protein